MKARRRTTQETLASLAGLKEYRMLGGRSLVSVSDPVSETVAAEGCGIRVNGCFQMSWSLEEPVLHPLSCEDILRLAKAAAPVPSWFFSENSAAADRSVL